MKLIRKGKKKKAYLSIDNSEKKCYECIYNFRRVYKFHNYNKSGHRDRGHDRCIKILADNTVIHDNIVFWFNGKNTSEYSVHKSGGNSFPLHSWQTTQKISGLNVADYSFSDIQRKFKSSACGEKGKYFKSIYGKTNEKNY